MLLRNADLLTNIVPGLVDYHATIDNHDQIWHSLDLS